MTMPQRHRYATRHELADLLATPNTTKDDFAAVLDALADCGAPVDGMIKVLTDDQDRPQAVDIPLDCQERPEDAARRLAGELVACQSLLLKAYDLLNTHGAPSVNFSDDMAAFRQALRDHAIK